MVLVKEKATVQCGLLMREEAQTRYFCIMSCTNSLSVGR